VGQPGRGGAHGAPAGQVEMPPRRRGRAERGGASTQRWERQQSEAEAGPVQDGDGGHDFSGSRFRLVCCLVLR
jgi:hypothetical protein